MTREKISSLRKREYLRECFTQSEMQVINIGQIWPQLLFDCLNKADVTNNTISYDSDEEKTEVVSFLRSSYY